MEDYEKLYKNSLGRGRIFRDHLLETGDKGIAREIEYIFPALADSKDERIRRNIIAALKGEGYYDCDLTNECIAWVEKQGDKDKLIKELGKYKVKYTQEVLSQQLEKQGEQKPTSDIKYEVSAGGSLIIVNDKPFDYEHATITQKDFAPKQELKKVEDEIEIPFGAKDSELQEETYYIPKGFHAEIDDDKVVIKKGEKSAAWSDEDEKMLKLCADEAEYYYTPKEENRIYKWLKSLKERIGR